MIQCAHRSSHDHLHSTRSNNLSAKSWGNRQQHALAPKVSSGRPHVITFGILIRSLGVLSQEVHTTCSGHRFEGRFKLLPAVEAGSVDVPLPEG